MGKWIDWRVTEDLTPGEWGELEAAVERQLRPALPVLARNLRSARRPAAGFIDRIAIWMRDRQTDQYAVRRDTIFVMPRLIAVTAVAGTGSFIFEPTVVSSQTGQSAGFQDFVSIGVLAAASQTSGKVALTGGDEIDTDYVSEIMRLLTASGCDLSPWPNFLEGIS